MSILLRNELEDYVSRTFLDENQIDALLQMISPYNFSLITSYWIKYLGTQNTSKIIEHILNTNRIDEWINAFGMEHILAFIQSYKSSLDTDLIKSIEKMCKHWYN